MRGIALVLLCLGAEACAADDFKVIRLEQQVLELERKVDELSRDLASLQQRNGMATAAKVSDPRPATNDGATDAIKWLSVAKWKRVHVGMSELDVIDALGPPTTLRGSSVAGASTLFYALELGPGAFLSGSVRFEKRAVVEVDPPVLR